MRLLLFMLILTVVSALVAAAGDRMGHRAARRKLRLGKLRPRDVSTIIAITTGVLISLATFGVGLLVSRDFRDALLRYDEIKRNTVKLEQTVKERETQLASAEESLKKQQVQLNALETDLDAKTQQSEQLGSKLQESEGKLVATVGQLSSKEAVLRKQEKRIRANEAKIEDQRAQSKVWGSMAEYMTRNKQAQQEELQNAAQRRLVLAKDEPLFYGRVKAADAGSLNQIVQSAISSVQRRLLDQYGLQISPGSESDGEAFINAFPYKGQDAMFVIYVAANIFEGDDAKLAYTADELRPLVKAGSVVLDVTVSEREASLSVFGAAARQFAVASSFDADSFADFAVTLQDGLLRAALDKGFLPELWTNDFPNPVTKLVDTAETLVGRARPFKIQFVAKHDLTALDGLADCEIHITSLADSRGAETTAEPAASADSGEGQPQ